MLLPLVVVAIVAALLYLFARQLARPSGWVGRAFMPRFLDQGNRALLDAALAALDAAPCERVVDVGFGGGYTLRRLAPAVAPERPVGVELSETLVEVARAEWGSRAELHLGDVAALPFADESVDGVLTVNTIYFWPDAAAGLRELHRVLKPDGRLVVGAVSKVFMLMSPITWFGFRLYTRAKLTALLRDAGFDVSDHPAETAQVVLVARPRTTAGRLAGCPPLRGTT